MLKNNDFIHYYFLENYLFLTVNENFYKNHRIDAFDFFSIVKWFDSKNIQKLMKQLIVLAKKSSDIPRSQQSNIDFVVKKITRDLYMEKDNKKRFEILFKNWKIPYSLSFAILSVLFPDDFVMLYNDLSSSIFKNKSLKDTEKIWKNYEKYINLINKKVPKNISLNDKVRFLLGKSLVHHLNEEIFKK